MITLSQIRFLQPRYNFQQVYGLSVMINPHAKMVFDLQGMLHLIVFVQTTCGTSQYNQVVTSESSEVRV